MMQLSTLQLNEMFLENIVDEPSCKLSCEDEAFYNSLQPELQKEVREPHASTIENLLAHSRKLSE